MAKRLSSRVVEPGQKPRKRSAAKEFQAWEAAGLHCSANERRADEASRDVEAWLKCKYMREHLGEEFAGTVSSVTTFGVFVTLDAMYVEGLVHITELGGDYFRFDEARQELRGERSGVRYGIGARVRVQVSRVDLDGRRIDFRLVRDGEDGLVQTPRSGRGQAKDEGRGRRESRDERSAGGYADKWSRRDAKANRAQRNAAAGPASAPEPDRAKQGRKAAKKAMLKSVNLAALEAEYAQEHAAPKPEPVTESVTAVQQAKPRKAAGRKKVAALLAPDAPAISVAKAAVKPESKSVAKPATKVSTKSVAKSAPKAVKVAAKPAAGTKAAPASKTSKRKTER